MKEGPSLIALFIAVLQMMEQSGILFMQEVCSSASSYPTDLFVWNFFLNFIYLFIGHDEEW